MRLFLLMLIVTAIEVVLIAKIGNEIGFFNTFLIIIVTAFIGSWQLKKQWRRVMNNLHTQKTAPTDALTESLILLICGVLLITPGFLTDIVGFLGLVPHIRHAMTAIIKKHLKVHGAQYFGANSTSQYYQFHTRRGDNYTDSDFSDYSEQRDSQNAKGKSSHQVLEGEYEKKED